MAETNTIGNSLSQVSRVGSLLLGEVRGGVAQHFDQDAFNSVIVTTLSDGTIPGRLSYRAFGAVRSQTGLINSPFRFNGYISDGGDELSSPSRYYSLGTGRFTSMDPAAPTQMDPLSWNAYVGLGANPILNIDPNGREVWGTEMILLNQRAASNNPGEIAQINQKLSAYQADESIRFQKTAGSAVGIGDFVVDTAVGAAVMAEAGIKSQIAHQSNGLIFGDQIRQNEQSSAAVREFITNHPYDRTVNALSFELSNIDALDARGDYFNSRRRGANLAANSAFAVTGVGGLMEGGVMMAGRVAARAGAFMSEVGTASRGAAVFSGDGAILAQIDADLAHMNRVARGIDSVTVVEGAGGSALKTVTSPTGLTVTLDADGVAIRWNYKVGAPGERGPNHRNVPVADGLHRGHVKAVNEGAGINAVDDGPMNIVGQTPNVNLSSIKRFENWRIKNAQGEEVNVYRTVNGLIRTEIPSKKIDVTYDPLASVKFVADWFLKGGTHK